MKRLTILFLPSLVGLFWREDPGNSIVWSLAGSLSIAAIAQTHWFTESCDRPFADQLLRPPFMFHFSFVIAHVIGGAFFALDNAGYTLLGQVAEPSHARLSLNAAAQALMLLSHASVTAGMKLGKFEYDPPKYLVAFLPPYALLVLSLLSSLAGTALASIPSLYNLADKTLQIASTLVMIELVRAVRRRHVASTFIASVLIILNLVVQTLSGWKGLALWSMITLGAMLYSLMPWRVLIACAAFVMFWALFLHPFGLELRPLVWYQGVDQETAVAMSLDRATSMSWGDRLDNVWSFLVERANDLHQFQRYLEYVPQQHAYFELDLVKQAIMGLAPRLLWPDKPDLEKVAMERVYAAGVVSAQSVVSSKSNFYQDAYLSWGWPAIIVASVVAGFVIMATSRICERYFGGYEIGTCLMFTSLFGTGVKDMPNFLFWVGAFWTSLLTVFALFWIGRSAGWLILADASSGLSTIRERGSSASNQ